MENTDIEPDVLVALGAFASAAFQVSKSSSILRVPNSYSGSTFSVPIISSPFESGLLFLGDKVEYIPLIENKEEVIKLNTRFVYGEVVIDCGYGELTKTFVYGLRG